MSRIRVLVVDDSVVVRRLISEALASDPDIEVIATASNGRLALERVEQMNPDIITLDIEMPELDGLAALRALRKTRPRLPVIMVSSLTERAAAATLDALAAGANDYVTKPSGLSSPDAVREQLREQLVGKVRLHAGRARAVAPAPAGVKPPGLRAPARPAARGQVEALAIGVSTGGPNALADLLPMLPADFPVPVLIVQHMPPLFTRLLAERLGRHCAMEVVEATSGAPVLPGKIYVAPGDWHLEVRRERGIVSTILNQLPQENSCRPAVDVLFRSVAAAYGAGALGLVLTGMGRDGFRGSESIVEAGGRVLAQDEATSVVWGMPGFVVEAGLTEAVLPLPAIGPAVIRLVMAGRRARVAP